MFACKMCPYSDSEVRDIYKVKSEMTFTTLKAIVDSVPNNQHYSFDISAIGETLRFRKLARFIQYMKLRKPRVNTIISTNGVLLTEDIAEALVRSGLDNLQVSLFAANKEDHEKVTGSKAFAKVTNNIKMLSAIKKKLKSDKPYVQTFIMEYKESKDMADQFQEEWAPYVDKAFVRPLYNLGRNIEGMTPNHTKTTSNKRYPCIQPWYATSIRSNGDVMPCYMYNWDKVSKEIVVGNVNRQSLEQIWASKLFQHFRDAHLNFEFEEYKACKNCDAWDAYTNVWEKDENGKFNYSKLRAKDFNKKVYEYRGG